MKNFRKLFAASLAVVSMLSLGGCGSDKSESVTVKSESDNPETTSIAETTEAPSVGGKMLKLSSCKVLCPDGWMAITPSGASDKTDDFSETQTLNIYKGARDETDFLHPLVQIRCVNTISDFEEFKSSFTDVADLDDVTAGDITYKVFKGTAMSYDYVCGQSNKDGNTISFMILTACDGESISIDDPDVMTILGSVEIADN